jgi:hypothetical protein
MPEVGLHRTQSTPRPAALEVLARSKTTQARGDRGDGSM